MKKLTWIHFSDLHFSVNEGFDIQFARDNLIKCLKDINKVFDYIFITGDIANRCDYGESKDFIDKLVKQLKMDDKKDRIFWAVGNHDIKRDVDKRNELINKIRDDKDPDRLNKALIDDVDHLILTQVGMKEYIKQSKTIFGQEFTKDEVENPHRFVKLNGMTHINIVILNTCLTSCDDYDEHKLRIIDPNFKAAFKDVDENKLNIVIGHHGKEFFNTTEQDKIESFFNDKKIDFYLCGHSHKLGYSYYGDRENPINQITCGGGTFDGYSKLSFMLGEYDIEAGIVSFTPYTYIPSGNTGWHEDFTSYRNLGKNNAFEINRLKPKTISTINGTEKISALLDNYKRSKEVLGANHEDTLATQYKLGRTYYEESKHGEAISVLLDNYERYKKVLGVDHKNTLLTQIWLGAIYSQASKYDEAIPVLLDNYERRKKILGADHENTLATQHWLGVTYCKTSKYDEAIPVFLDNYERRKEILGADHEDTLATQLWLGRTYYEVSKHGEAIPVFLDNYKRYKEVLGVDHKNTLLTQNWLGATYSQASKYDEAIPVFLDNYERRKEILGADHEDTLETQYWLGRTYYQANKYGEAIPVLLDNYERRKEILGVDHKNTLSTQIWLGATYCKVSKYDEAIPVLLDNYERRKEILGAGHEDTLATQHWLERTYKEAEKQEQ